MDDTEELKISLYTKLLKIKSLKIYELNTKYGGILSPYDVEELVEKSIAQTFDEYDEEKGANYLTFFQLILDRYTMNKIRNITINNKNNSNEKSDSEDIIFEPDKDYIEVSDKSDNNPKTFMKKVPVEEGGNISTSKKYEEYDMEIVRKVFSNFVQNFLKEGDEKNVFYELVNLIYPSEIFASKEVEEITWKHLAEKCRIKERKVYDIKKRIENKFITYIKKLPIDLRDLLRVLTFELKPGETTKFSYLLEKKFEISIENYNRLSTFNKILNLIFTYQEKKFYNFIFNEISDNNIENIVKHFD